MVKILGHEDIQMLFADASTGSHSPASSKTRSDCRTNKREAKVSAAEYLKKPQEFPDYIKDAMKQN